MGLPSQSYGHHLPYEISSLSVLLSATQQLNIHRVPKLATPLAPNTLNLVRSSWISTKYRTLHYFDVTYC